MTGHRPVPTGWSGYFEDSRELLHKITLMEFNSLEIRQSVVSGDGEDRVGKFMLDGKRNGDSIEFAKTYSGSPVVVYKGTLGQTEDGHVIEGRWHLKTSPDVSGKFEIASSSVILAKRNYAFQMVVAEIKMRVGFIKFVFEDFAFSVIQVLFLARNGMNLDSMITRFTLYSLCAGLAVSMAGPIYEAWTRRKHKLNAGIISEFPPSVDGEDDIHGSPVAATPGSPYLALPRESSPSGEGVEGSSGDALEAYKAKVEHTRALTKFELLSGNMDYVEALMERPDMPAQVLDVAITDVIVSSPGFHRVMVASALLLWCFILAVPFAFQIECSGGVPLNAHLCFMLVSALNIGAQLWCAVATKYGYLVLVHAPQRFLFGGVLSLMGFFDSYSDICFIPMARSCGSPLWKPAAFVYIVGVVLAQALPGITLLACKRRIPSALKLTDMNMLLMLLKPSARQSSSLQPPELERWFESSCGGVRGVPPKTLTPMQVCKTGHSIYDPETDTVKIDFEPENLKPQPMQEPTPEELEAEEKQREQERHSQWHAKEEMDKKKDEQRRRKAEAEKARTQKEEEEQRAEGQRRKMQEEQERRAAVEAETRRREEAERLQTEQKQKSMSTWLTQNGYSGDVNTPKKTYMKSKYPINTAAKQGNIEMTAMLMEEGAICAQPDSRGRTAYDVAVRKNTNGSHNAVLEVLKRQCGNALNMKR